MSEICLNPECKTLYCRGCKPRKLAMRKYTITVKIVPPTLEVKLYGAKIETKTITIEGYTKKDAMRRAGIQ